MVRTGQVRGIPDAAWLAVGEDPGVPTMDRANPVVAEVSYPLEVEGRLDPQLSRWLWLVKWLLAIPHFVVLAFLWIAFFVLTFVALVAIVFTGRYPPVVRVQCRRASLDVAGWLLHVRGAWHRPVSAVYPRPSSGLPARLDVAYPERLSRGLALVKWWLLAIPQYVIVAFFLGSGAGARFSWAASGVGLIDMLVLFAGVALLFTGRYPRGIFDLAVGLDRWALRVAAYAGLMTDRYPPFRLDMGGPNRPPGSRRPNRSGRVGCQHGVCSPATASRRRERVAAAALWACCSSPTGPAFRSARGCSISCRACS